MGGNISAAAAAVVVVLAEEYGVFLNLSRSSTIMEAHVVGG